MDNEVLMPILLSLRAQQRESMVFPRIDEAIY